MSEGGGGDFFSSFFRTVTRKNPLMYISFSFHFALYVIFNITNFFFWKILKSAHWLNGKWFLQIVNRDSVNLYPIYPLFPCSDLLSQMWGGGGGGNVFLSFYAISNISRNK